MKFGMIRVPAALTLVAAAVFCCVAGRANAGPYEDLERKDLEALRQSAPKTYALIEQGDAAHRAGDLAGAASFYAQATIASPQNVVPIRDGCRVALERGQETRAFMNCQRAFMLGGIIEDRRNNVAAIMGLSAGPSMGELVSASLLTESAVRDAPNEPWGYLARCDIARRLGDRAGLDACIADLKRVAPEHPQTKRMLALSPASASAGTWVGRVVVGLALLLTLFHALFRRRLSFLHRSAPVVTIVAALYALLSALAPLPARAEPRADRPDRLSNYDIDDANPDSSVPSIDKQNRDPLEFGYLLQDLLAKALKASEKGNHAAAARYYHALTIAAPSRSYAFSKTCEEYAAAGDRARALDYCEQALAKEGVTVGDYQKFVQLVLAQPEPLTDEQKKVLGNMIDELSKTSGTTAIPQELRCEVALRVHDVPGLEACSGALAKLAPKDPKTVSFQWALALEKHDGDQARALIGKARQFGMSKAGLEKMQAATDQAARTRLIQLALMGLATVVGAALIFYLSRRFLASRRSQQQPASV
jgi:hypothetical protein